MKILFLDHDGVICLSSEWGSRYKNKEGLDSVFDRFNEKAIKVLNEIIEETDCEIVISSDWRFHASLSQMRELYKIRGIIKQPIGYTGYVKSNSADLEWARATEINNWLDTHDTKSVMKWVAVDDLDMLMDRLMLFHLTKKVGNLGSIKNLLLKVSGMVDLAL